MALFASGQGTNVKNILRYAREVDLHLNFRCIITDNPQAPVLRVGEEFDLPVKVIRPAASAPGQMATKEKYETEILEYLSTMDIHWIFLCGFMRILGKTLLTSFYDEELKQNRIINIHPAYLPEFPGKNSYERAYHSSQKESGVTVHFVDGGVDTGKIILQQRFPKIDRENIADFVKRGQQLEYALYRKVVKKVSDYQKGETVWSS